jgi:VWFA-related protein
MMLITRRDLVVGAASRVFAQEATFSADVRIVTLFANVHDKTGAVVTNLQEEDFLLEDSGVRQKIRYYSRESDLPLSIGLLIDTSKSQSGVLDRELSASSMFLDQMLREGKDEAFVARFDIQVEVLQDLTFSKRELRLAFNELKIARQGSTLLYQAIRECAEREMKRQHGRKAFIVLTDGVDENSKTDIATAIEYAQNADTIVYSILFSKRPWMAYSPAAAVYYSIERALARAVMQRLAQETGGACFDVSKGHSLERVYAMIQERLRNQYSIGYTPEPKNNGQRYRQIRLTTRQSGLVVQTRAGYYTK